MKEDPSRALFDQIEAELVDIFEQVQQGDDFQAVALPLLIKIHQQACDLDDEVADGIWALLAKYAPGEVQ